MHVPVLQKELIELLAPANGQNFIDGTINGGGHAQLILERTGPRGKLLGIDLTPELIEKLENDFREKGMADRAVLVCDNFARIGDIVLEKEFKPVHGIVLDLGMSSWHLEDSGRGFSFSRDEKLDMRFNPHNELSAWTVVNRWSEEELGAAIRDYGQERFWRKIASRIVAERQLKPLDRTGDLVEVIEGSVPGWYRQQRIHPATKTFQALRIVVNRELANLSRVLPQAVGLLVSGGRMAVISFHELEDRTVKQFFKAEEEKGSLQLLTKRAVKASEKEVRENRRARSARLRAIIKN